jgi:hypothetical protein
MHPLFPLISETAWELRRLYRMTKPDLPPERREQVEHLIHRNVNVMEEMVIAEEEQFAKEAQF